MLEVLKTKFRKSKLLLPLKDLTLLPFQKTWLDPSFYDSQLFDADTFSVFRKDRNTHGGGILLAVKSTLSPSLITDYSCDTIEIIWVDFNCPFGKGLIGCCYRPPK